MARALTEGARSLTSSVLHDASEPGLVKMSIGSRAPALPPALDQSAGRWHTSIPPR